MLGEFRGSSLGRKYLDRRYLLSDHLRIMAGFDFERAVVGPQVDRVGDARNAPLVHL